MTIAVRTRLSSLGENERVAYDYPDAGTFMVDLWTAGKPFLKGFRHHSAYLIPAVFLLPGELYEYIVRPNFGDATWWEHLIVPGAAFPWVLGATVLWTAFLTYRDLHKERSGALTNVNETEIQRSQHAQSTPVPVLVPQDAYYLHDEDAKGYPHKLKIVLTNKSAGDIIVTPAEWRNIWNFTSPPLNEHPWQPEGPHGWQNKDWGEETHEPLLVRPGRAIQTWVGLPAPLGEVKLRRRIMTKRLGSLIVPFTIDRRATSETIRL
jgi:hypothetical protein